MDAALIARKYEALSLRERALAVLAVLAVLVMSWDSLMMDPLRQRRSALEAELANAGSFGAVGMDLSDPRQVSIRRAGELQLMVASLDAQVGEKASGFVSAERMVEVLHDVLDRQGRLELVSIRNLPVVSLVPPPSAPGDASMPAGTGNVSADPGAAGAQEPQPPFLHGVEIIVDGEYSDILEYLAALEALPWKFRWSVLELNTAGYPRNRVRIELATLSLDATWLGV